MLTTTLYQETRKQSNIVSCFVWDEFTNSLSIDGLLTIFQSLGQDLGRERTGAALVVGLYNDGVLAELVQSRQTDLLSPRSTQEHSSDVVLFLISDSLLVNLPGMK